MLVDELIARMDSSRAKAGSIIRIAVSLLRLKPFDHTSFGGRSRERYRRAALTSIASAFARAISAGTMLFAIPLTVHYLGSERFALWMTITSVVGMMAFADFGIGNGLLNALSNSNGRDDRESASCFVSSAFVMLSAIGTSIIFLVLVIYRIIPWPHIFNVKSPLAIREAGPACAVFIACFALSLPSGIVQRVQFGYQEGYRAHLWVALGSLLGFIGLLLVVHFRAGLPWLVMAVTGGPVASSLMNASVFFSHRPWLLPRLSKVNRQVAKRLFQAGSMFFIVQVAMTVGYQADNIIIAQILGAEQVTQYAVPFKLFSIVPMLLSVIMMPLWPAYGEAISRGDRVWVVKTLKRSIVLGAMISIPTNLLLIIFGRQILQAWAGPGIVPSFALLCGLGFWGVLTGMNWPLAMFLNGVNAIRLQAVCGSAMAVVSICLAIILVRTIGLSGTVYAMILAQIVCVLIPLASRIPRLLDRVYPQRPSSDVALSEFKAT